MGPQAEMLANAAEERGEDTPETYIPPEVPEGLESSGARWVMRHASFFKAYF